MTNSFKIGEATVADLPACAKIVNDYIDETPWLPRTISREKLERLFNADMLKARLFLVAKFRNEIAGYLSLEPAINKIHGFYIAARYRGFGVGKTLLDGCKNKHGTLLNLTVFEPNIEAQRFYRREGFVEIIEKREVETEEGVPTLYMQWQKGGAV